MDYLFVSVFSWAVIVGVVGAIGCLITSHPNQPYWMTNLFGIFMLMLVLSLGVAVLLGLFWIGHGWLEFMNAWPVGGPKQ